MMYSDKTHMQAGIPALLAAYTTAASIAEYLGQSPEIIETSDWVPTQENALLINASDGKGGGLTHGEARGVTEDNIELVRQIAIDTVRDMP